MQTVSGAFFALLVALVLAQDPLPLDKLRLPPGFKIELLARVPQARQLALNPSESWLFVGSFDYGKVHAIPLDKSNGTYVAGKARVIASSYRLPVGVAFDASTGSLFVSQVNKIVRFDNIENSLQSNESIPAPTELRTYFDDDWHGWKVLHVKGNRVYVPQGSPCNTCLRSEEILGTMTSFDKRDGSDFKIHFRGMRNTVGFTWSPRDDNLMYWSENGRDEWGNDRPGDELNIFNMSSTTAHHYGFPYCYEKNLNDPEYYNGSCIRNTTFTPAAWVLGPHVAALGVRFYTAQAFPPAYRGGNIIFIAEHGSWNREVPLGYRVTMVDTSNPDASSYKIFIDGWLQLPPEGSNDSKYAWGRPTDIWQLQDGSLLISDDKAGAIYRVSYVGTN